MAEAPNNQTEIRPQAGPQEAALSSPADIVILGGAAGVGKTWAILVEPLRHYQVKGFSTVIFRRQTTQIRNPGGLWDASMQIYPAVGARPIETTLEWEFRSGVRVKFAHMEYETDRLAWDGAEVPLIEFDQLEHFIEGQFWYMLSRNRSTCGVKPYIRATCNPVPPDDETGGWLNRLIAWWIDQETGYPIWERSGVVRWFVRVKDEVIWGDSAEELRARCPDVPDEDFLPKSLTFIPGRLEHNPILMRRDPGYRANLLALPFVERERLLGGNWLVRPSAGKIFNRAWFDVIPVLPAQIDKVIRYWDKAGTEGGGKRTAGVLMLKCGHLYVIADVTKGQWGSHNREKIIKQVTDADREEYLIKRGIAVTTWTEMEPGSGGKESAENTIINLAGHDIHAERVTGDKITRAGPLSAQAEAHNVKLLQGPWNEEFLKEAHAFAPKSGFKDQIDAASGAFNKLALGFPEPVSLAVHPADQREAPREPAIRQPDAAVDRSRFSKMIFQRAGIRQ